MKTTLALILGMVSLLASSNVRSAKAADAEFKPIMEAELPTGFPSYTPVDQIEVKQYPAYRKAVSSGSAAFWSLFNHIKQNKIAMTAPVEMTYGSGDSESIQQQSMAFLYGQPSLGSTGSQGTVKVVDVPAAKVVSIGVRGARTDAKVNAAREKLNDWLVSNTGLQAIGELRVMGYNSPFVPRDRQFFEVQIEVKDAQ